MHGIMDDGDFDDALIDRLWSEACAQSDEQDGVSPDILAKVRRSRASACLGSIRGSKRTACRRALSATRQSRGAVSECSCHCAGDHTARQDARARRSAEALPRFRRKAQRDGSHGQLRLYALSNGCGCRKEPARRHIPHCKAGALTHDQPHLQRVCNTIHWIACVRHEAA